MFSRILSLRRRAFLFCTLFTLPLAAQESTKDVHSQSAYLIASSPSAATAGAEPAGNMGSLNYPINFEIPPSRNGTQPELTLIYNSANQTHGSFVGQSWSLNMNYIERSLKSGVPTYTANDEFLISLGKAQGELVLIDSRADTMEYRVANEKLFLLIYFIIPTNSWVAIDKKGTEYLFGQSGASQVVSGTSIFRWALDRVFSTQFNHNTLYTYIKPAGNLLYPSRIDYFHGRIDFTYNTHPQPFRSFKTGFGVTTTQLLSDITASYRDTGTVANFIPMAIYDFKYKQLNCAVDDTNNILCLTPYLESITRFNGTRTDSLPPTRFDYNDQSLQLANDQLVKWLIPLVSGAGFTEDDGEDNNALEIVDINGDQFPDLVQADGDDQRITLFNNKTSGWVPTDDYRIPVIEGGGFTEDDGTGDNGVRLVDVNRDGFVDIVQGDGDDQHNTFLNNTINGWATSATWILPVIAGAGFTEDDGEDDNGVRFADVNHDGFVDIMQGDGDDQHTTFLSNTSDGWVVDTVWVMPVIASGGFTEDNGEGDNGVRLADVNHDGFIDLVQADGNNERNTFINDPLANKFLSDPRWQVPVVAGAGFTEDDSEGDNGLRFAEVNGDGFIDLIQADGDDQRATFLNNTVDGWFADPRWRVPVIAGAGFTEDDGDGDNGVRIADINHDGFDDIVVADGNDMAQHITFLNNRVDGWDLVSIPLSRVDFEGNWNVSSDWEFPTIDRGGFNEKSGDGNNGVRLADVNSDGYIDILQADGNDSDQHITYLNNGRNGWELTPKWQVPVIDKGGFTDEDGSGDNTLQVTDLNSDGYPDLIMADGNDPDQHVAFLNDQLGTFVLNPGWIIPMIDDGGFTESDGDGDNGVRIADVDGDGYPDIVEADGEDRITLLNNRLDRFIDTTIYVFPEIDGGGFTESGGDDDNGVRFLDVNGDGLIDIVQADDEDQRAVFINRGNGTWTGESNWSIPNIHDAGFTEDGGDGDNAIRFADLNFDGFVDLVQGDGDDQRDVYLNNGFNGWFKVTSWQIPLITSGGFTEDEGEGDNGLNISDVNGDGFPDLVQADGLEERRTYLNGMTQPPLLDRIDNGIGGIVTITYKTHTGKPVLYMVDEIRENDGFTEQVSQFRFEEPYFDQDEEEFRGFGHAIAILGDAVSETFYHQANGDDILTHEEGDSLGMEGYLYFSKITSPTNPNFNLQAHRNNWLLTVDRIHPEYHIVQLASEVQYEFASDGILHTAQAKGYEYDSIGDVVHLTDFKYVGDESMTGHFSDLVVTDNVITVTEYARDIRAPNTIRGFPSRIMVKDINGAILRESRILYDQRPLGELLFGLPSMEQKLRVYTSRELHPRDLITNINQQSPEHVPYLDTMATFVYDGFGNITRRTNPNGNIKFYFYDRTGQYVVRDSMVMRIGKSSPLPLVNRYKFDPRNGAQFEIKAPNGAITRKTFDDFGRIIDLAQSNVNDVTLVLSKENYQYELLGGSGQVAANRIVMNIRQDGYAVVEQEITYLDGFFNKIQCKYLASDTTFHGYRTQSYTYGLNGKVERSFQPYFTTDEAFTPIDFSLPNIVTHYDALGRVVRLQPDQMSEADSPMAGETTEYTLSGFQQEQISTKGDHTIRYIYNSGGKITDIFQDVGKKVFHTQYEYDLLDRLTRIVDEHGAVTNFSYDSMDEKREMNDPSTGHNAYFYDGAGNVLRYVDAKKDTTFFQYDELYRILSKRFSADASQTIKYTYDENGFRGFLTKLTSVAVISSYRYNSIGNIIRQERKIESQTLVMESEYDPYGRLLRLTYPDGSKVSYQYYLSGAQLKEVKLDNVTLAIFEKYDPLMKPLKYRFNNGVSTDNIFYPANDRIKDSSVKDRTGKEIQGFAFRFDDFGNVRFVQNRILQTRRAYDHDALNRLISADTWTGSNPLAVHENFAYDEIGNLTSKDGKAYVYETNRPYVLSQFGTQTFTNDPNGNQTKGSNGRSYKYDVMDRLVEVRDQGNAVLASFKYDASTGRAVRASAGVTTIYFDNLFEKRVQGGRSTVHIYALGKIISTVVSNNTPQRLIQFYHQDHLGSITLISGVNGEVTARFDYKPYGEQVHISGAATSSFGFTGQPTDKDVGLIYYQSRYYDPVIGRFIQPDRFIPQPADPQTLNRYTYVGNNPVTFVDPTGHWFGVDDLIAFGVGFAIGFTTTLLTSDFNWKLAFYSGLANGLGFWLAYNTLGASALYYYGSAQVLASASNEVFAGDRGGTFGDVVQLVTTFAASPITSTVGLLVGTGFIVFTDRTWSHDFHFVDGSLWFQDPFRGKDAMTTGAVIHYRDDLNFSEETMAHELIHRRQFGNIGDSFVPYYFIEIGIRWIGPDNMDEAYHNQFFEAEAYSRESSHGNLNADDDAIRNIQLFDLNVLVTAPGRF